MRLVPACRWVAWGACTDAIVMEVTNDDETDKRRVEHFFKCSRASLKSGDVEP